MPFSEIEMILAQARSNVLLLEPRIKVTRECIECLEKGFRAEADVEPKEPLGTLIVAIAQVQLTQLKAALVELEDSLSKSRNIIAEHDTLIPSRLFTPRGTGGRL
jgi:hypothetical protein